MIYFIQQGDAGPIKIGYTARPIEARMGEIQTASPTPLRLVATMDGGTDQEGKLHQHFYQARQQGEWFAPTPDLWQFIREQTNLCVAPPNVTWRHRIKWQLFLAMEARAARWRKRAARSAPPLPVMY